MSRAFDEYKPPKVSKDLANAVEDDWMRGVQDAAKHRAVKQLEGYEAFKNMVSVAHLRPHNAPNVKDHSGPMPPALQFSADGTRGGPVKTPGARGKLSDGSDGCLTPPDSAMAFEKTWRRACKTAEERWRYLGVLSPERAAAVFKVEVTGTALGEMIAALAEGYGSYVGGSKPGGGEASGSGSEESWGGAAGPAEVGAAVVALLSAMTGAGRFGLASKLLPAKTKKALEGLFVTLVANGGCDAAVEAELKAAYGVK